MKSTNDVRFVAMTALTLLLLACPTFALTVISPTNGSITNNQVVFVQYHTSSSSSCQATFNGAMITLPGCANFTMAAQYGDNFVQVWDGTDFAEIHFSYQPSTVVISPGQNSLAIPPGGDVVVSNVPKDDPNPLTAIFSGPTTTNDGITADKKHYDVPPGTRFSAYVKIRNTGITPDVTVVASTLHGSVVSLERVSVTTKTEGVAYPVIRYSTTEVCDATGECKPAVNEEVVETRTRQVQRYNTTIRPLLIHSGDDWVTLLSRISNPQHRAPVTAHHYSASDSITPGSDAIYRITFKSAPEPGDEFFISAFSPTLAAGLDPFVNTNWSYVRNLTLNETFNISRTNQLVYINLTGFRTDQLSNCSREIRISNNTFDDIPVRVVSDGGNLSSNKFCAITFGSTLGALTSTKYYVYFGNPTATVPAAATNANQFWNLTWSASPLYFPNADFGTGPDSSDQIAPIVVDYNCNGATDLLYGIDDGVVWLRNNTGTNTSPVWSAAIDTGVADIGANSVPKLALLFGANSLLDFVVGESTGNLNYFENTGTCTVPTWTAKTFANDSFDYGTDSHPATGDLTGDNLVDLIVGLSTGQFDSAKNYNTTTLAAYYIGGVIHPGDDVGSAAAPELGDLNFDGVLDLLVGDNSGNINLFWNNGTNATENWTAPVLQTYNNSATSIDVGSDAVPYLFDINRDGWSDLTIGEAAGFISIDTAAGNDGKYLLNTPINITSGSTNARPRTVMMNITPLSPFHNASLNCTGNFTDEESGTFQVNFTWSQNGVINNTMNASVTCTNATLCNNTRAVAPGNLTIGDVWTCTANIFDGFWMSVGTVNTTIQNAPPLIQFTPFSQNVVLNAGTTKTISCNFTVQDIDGNVSINSTNATAFFLGTSSTASDANTTHYTNSSCSVTGTNASLKNYTCGFSLLYYATNGSWICNATVNDTYSINSSNGSFALDPLFAINVTNTSLDFGNLQTGDISSNVTENITNVGNQPINISVKGYGRLMDDNWSFVCSTLNLTVGSLKFAPNDTADYATKQNLSGSLTSSKVVVGSQVDPTQTWNLSYWQIQIPPLTPSVGECNGTIVFQAETYR